jgi:hypothetical protein
MWLLDCGFILGLRLLKVLQTGHRWLAVHAWLWSCNAIEQAAKRWWLFAEIAY